MWYNKIPASSTSRAIVPVFSMRESTRGGDKLGNDFVELHLKNMPWPVSINELYAPIIKRRLSDSGKMIPYASFALTKKGKKYKQDLAFIVMSEIRKQNFKKLEDGVMLCVNFFPPDKRKHDTSNLLKVTEDAFELAGVYTNDNNIVRHFLDKIEPTKNHSGFFDAIIMPADRMFY